MRQKDIFGNVTKAATNAFGRVNKVFGFQTNPDIQLYNNLKPADFMALAKKYGQDTTADYIRWAESKKLTQKG